MRRPRVLSSLIWCKEFLPRFRANKNSNDNQKEEDLPSLPAST